MKIVKISVKQDRYRNSRVEMDDGKSVKLPVKLAVKDSDLNPDDFIEVFKPKHVSFRGV